MQKKIVCTFAAVSHEKAKKRLLFRGRNRGLYILKVIEHQAMGEFQSGQMGQTVNLLSIDFGGSNPSSPTHEESCGSSSVDRALAFQAEGRGFESRLPLS